MFQRKEAQGDDDTLSNEITGNLAQLTKENLEPLTVFQVIKQLQLFKP